MIAHVRAGEVHAQSADGVDDLFREASSAEQSAEPLRAYELYGKVVEAAPTSRLAARAKTRRGNLEQAAAGDWASLDVLAKLRSQPTVELHAPDLRRAEATVRALPNSEPGHAAWMWLVDAELQRGDPAIAMRLGEEALTLPGWSVDARARLVRLVAAAARRAGSDAKALSVLRAGGVSGGAIATDIERDRRIARVLRVSGVALAVSGVFLVVLGLWGFPRRRPLVGGLGYVGVTLLPAIGGFAIGYTRDASLAPVLAIWAAGVATLTLLSHASGRGAGRLAARLGRWVVPVATASACVALIAWTFAFGALWNPVLGWY
ncbi:MAG: hypothetical protein R3A78_09830 [Polyangiales bacterium]